MSTKHEARTITLEYDLPHPPAKVWRALTDPALLEKWLMANDMRPAVGHSFKFRQKPTPWWDGIVHCEVLEVKPQMRLSYTWRGGVGPTEVDTVVTWTLAPTPRGTRLTLEHSGFLPANAPAYDGAMQGWSRMVGEGLRKVLADGA